MDILQRYITGQDRHFSQCLDQTLPGASIFVVIPCYNEPDILSTLNSLAECVPPKSGVEVVVVVNDAEGDDDSIVVQNNITLKLIEAWKENKTNLFFEVKRVLAHALPRKWAGVGWARKIGMDQVVRQLTDNGDPEGIIVSLDADSTVLPNYLQVIEKAFEEAPKCHFFTIHFEHCYHDPYLDPLLREGIVRYELHMRYFRNAMQWCGYPNAIHTVGSSFALKATAYAKQGGMNRRKAGEDFYFLHKLVLLGVYGNISTTTVFPASRNSDRVPFGTGAAIKKWSEGSRGLNLTYSFEPFRNLKCLFDIVPTFWSQDNGVRSDLFDDLHPSLIAFCRESKILEQITELRENCASRLIFEKRLYHLLNAFWILKYLNFAHESCYRQGDLVTMAVLLLQQMGVAVPVILSIDEVLEIFRDLDKRVQNCG